MHIDLVIKMPLASMLNVKMVMLVQPVDDGHMGGNRSTNGDDGYDAGQYDWSR